MGPASGTGNPNAPIQLVSAGAGPAIRTLAVASNAEDADALSRFGGGAPVVRVDESSADTRGVVGILIDFERVVG